MKETEINSQKQIGIMIAIVAIVLIGMIVLISMGSKDKNYLAEEEQGQAQTKVIEGEKLAEVKQYKGLDVSNVKFETKEDCTVVTADINNNTNVASEGQYININVLDKEGNKITDVRGYIDPIKVGGKTTLSTKFLSNGKEESAHDIEITEKREKKQEENSINLED